MARAVYIDRDLCTGCSLCCDEVPDVFVMGDDGVAQVRDGSADDLKLGMAPEAKWPDVTDVENAADDCPASCIIIADVNSEGNKIE